MQGMQGMQAAQMIPAGSAGAPTVTLPPPGLMPFMLNTTPPMPTAAAYAAASAAAAAAATTTTTTATSSTAASAAAATAAAAAVPQLESSSSQASSAEAAAAAAAASAALAASMTTQTEESTAGSVGGQSWDRRQYLWCRSVRRSSCSDGTPTQACRFLHLDECCRVVLEGGDPRGIPKLGHKRLSTLTQGMVSDMHKMGKLEWSHTEGFRHEDVASKLSLVGRKKSAIAYESLCRLMERCGLHLEEALPPYASAKSALLTLCRTFAESHIEEIPRTTLQAFLAVDLFLRESWNEFLERNGPLQATATLPPGANTSGQPTETQRLKKECRCFCCRELGHYARDCPCEKCIDKLKK
eukprot:Rhum_TRINITY_DN14408_c47_g1::Rhum_TRINITY_DN14408_c47_g1_i1::g.88727::m.88727